MAPEALRQKIQSVNDPCKARYVNTQGLKLSCWTLECVDGLDPLFNEVMDNR